MFVCRCCASVGDKKAIQTAKTELTEHFVLKETLVVKDYLGAMITDIAMFGNHIVFPNMPHTRNCDMAMDFLNA